MKKFEELKSQNREIEVKLSDEMLEVNEKIKLKKIMYQNKLEMLDLIHEEEKQRFGITAGELIEKVNNMPTYPKYATGIYDFDNAIGGGFETGLFVNLAGESGSGKTTLLLKILSNMAQSRKVVFFNFEMGIRLLAKKLKALNLSQEQLNNLITDSDSTDIDDLIMEIELYSAEGIKFFCIDSKMKITSKKQGQEYQIISYISNLLSKLCAKKDITIFLINQTSEEDLKNKRLSFKGSGDQKYDTDIALFLVKEEEQRKLICNKNRMNDKLFAIDITENKPIITEYQTIGRNNIVPDNDFLSNIA